VFESAMTVSSKRSVFEIEAITWRLRFDSPCKHTLCNIGCNTELHTDLSSYWSFWHNKMCLLKTNSLENELRTIFIGPAIANFLVHIRYHWFRFSRVFVLLVAATPLNEIFCVTNLSIYAACSKLMSRLPLPHTLLFF